MNKGDGLLPIDPRWNKTEHWRAVAAVAQAILEHLKREASRPVGFLKGRSASGQMIAVESWITVADSSGSDRVPHYNSYPAADTNSSPAMGVSSGLAETAMLELAEKTPPNRWEANWTELTYQRILAGNTAMYIYQLYIFLVFLLLIGLARKNAILIVKSAGHL